MSIVLGEDDCIVCTKSTLKQARIKASGKVYHEGCFVCTNCKNSLESFFNVQGKLYCDDCERNLFAKKCVKCSLAIESTVVTAKGKTFHNDCFRCGGVSIILYILLKYKINN
ncbi:hypothetical protein DICPUDRAFT_32600 [Dictyostelium purpureum]|uniref:LIM zinc-binding domain-containing protein n=1 Tax=Dictyostelium purpureum TaxID=5786 RepID=F0ZJE2_DICPU|nr:uncharacterized protein DICPUDRAFT_32600 [Dictyostelium purpureum]EGC35967.1 hypothetical protein DICPUDRAFT_32600 [Dictyostelium purpureum]|eukprot:XP_003287540.1 hypothetical protein DICPUDRAFT_32600 [Dictyostelium purpureum]